MATIGLEPSSLAPSGLTATSATPDDYVSAASVMATTHLRRGMTIGGLLILDAREWRTGINARHHGARLRRTEARRTARNDGGSTTTAAAHVKLERERDQSVETKPVLLVRTTRKEDGHGGFGRTETTRKGTTVIPGGAM